MSPRDKLVAEVLELAAACVLPPRPGRWQDRDAFDILQRERAIQVASVLNAVAGDLRMSAACADALLPHRLATVQEYAAEPLPYEPYQAQPEAAV